MSRKAPNAGPGDTPRPDPPPAPPPPQAASPDNVLILRTLNDLVEQQRANTAALLEFGESLNMMAESLSELGDLLEALAGEDSDAPQLTLDGESAGAERDTFDEL